MSDASAAQQPPPQEPDEQSAADSTQSQHEALPQELLEQLTAWFQHSLAAGGELANLFRLELQLTLGDARRLVLVTLALVPMLLLAWMSLSVLAGWLVYESTTSVAGGLATIAVMQLIVVAALLWLGLRYRRQLGFRRTKAHARRLLQGVQGEPPTTN
ncbi:hypothetical protein [Halopseudomonas sp.]|uniref:hypothetical protein n=1 Tax=Halopseudomonas sp. TaxID=2901191 RepID=UPI0030032F6F